MRSDRDSAVADFRVRAYYRNGGPWMWVDRQGVDQRADTLLDILREQVPMMGFTERSFKLTQIATDMLRLRTLNFEGQDDVNTVSARLEFCLTKAFVRYAMGQRYGFVNPSFLFNRLDASKIDTLGRALDYHCLFDIDVQHPAENYVQAALAKVARDSVGEYLREVATRDSLYFRLMRLLPTADGAKRQRLLCNMERRRWREDSRPGSTNTYVLVNLPAYHLWAVCPDSIVDMRVGCGAQATKTPTTPNSRARLSTPMELYPVAWANTAMRAGPITAANLPKISKTPLLTSHITHMNVNPEWVIPNSIIRNEVSRHAGDGSYFGRHRYSIVNRSTGQQVSPSEVSRAMLESGKYRVAQAGGAGNSLGRIIFRFPNKFSVFLHDTSSPGVFMRDNRSVSHGCVRVQRPFQLACFLWGEQDEWQQDRLRISMGLKPETERGRNYMADEEKRVNTRLVNYLPVKSRVPLYITYYTMYPDPVSNELCTYPDIYGYDAAVGDALKTFMQ